MHRLACRSYFREEIFDTTANFVANGTHGVEALSSWIIELPIEVPFARKEWTGITTAHSNNNVAGFDSIIREQFRLLI